MMTVALWILEDDAKLGELLQKLLSAESRDLAVRLFGSGEEALEAKGAPDLLFADTHLKGKLTGPEVACKLRQRNPDLAILYSSAQGRPEGVILGPRDRELPKPFSMGVLMAEVLTMITQIPRRQVPPRSVSAARHYWKHQ
jgi:DNA-binding response OmpR family regulator